MWFPFHTDWISDQDSQTTCLTKVNILFITLKVIPVHERLYSIVVLLHAEQFYDHLKRTSVYFLEKETLPISSLTLFQLCVPVQKRCLELVANQKHAYRMKPSEHEVSTKLFIYNARDVFACNIWTNDRKLMRLGSEVPRVRAGTVHE
jgi:hypothetical protein